MSVHFNLCSLHYFVSKIIIFIYDLLTYDIIFLLFIRGSLLNLVYDKNIVLLSLGASKNVEEMSKNYNRLLYDISRQTFTITRITICHLIW